MYYVYVLQSEKNGRLYTGSTNSIERRLSEHNSGLSKYTRSTRPYKLQYLEEYSTRQEAVKREMHLKTGRGRAELKDIIEKNRLMGA